MARALLVFVASAALLIFVNAQATSAKKGATGLEQEVLKIEQEKIKAMLAGGAIAADWFARMEDDNLTYIAPFRGSLSKAQYVDQYRSGEFKVHASEHYNFHVTIYNADTAVVTYLTRNTNEVKGRVHGGTHAAATDVFFKRDGQWRHIVHHVTLIAPR